MRISVLCENTSYKNEFESEHGLSLLITTEKHKILFDAGQSDLFLRNAERLGEDLRDVDLVVLSHGHYDHCNGMKYFLERNSVAKVILHEKAFGEFFHGGRYIGMDATVKSMTERMMPVDSSLSLGDGLDISAATDLPALGDTALEQTIDGVRVPDPFDHELYLTVTQGHEKVLFTGCGHRGIVSIAQKAVEGGVTHIVGGFHLTEELCDEALERIAKQLNDFPVRYYSGHCTCRRALEILRKTLGARFATLSCGYQFAVGGKGEVASALFRNGYNCSQSVFGAFAEELGIPFETAVRLACSFGGGMGRLREVCGAVSGMLLVCGMEKGYHTPETGAVKAEHYRLVQSVANRFRKKHGSLSCRELLGGTASDLPTPTERTPAFYKSRPCERLIASAAELIEEAIFKA